MLLSESDNNNNNNNKTVLTDMTDNSDSPVPESDRSMIRVFVDASVDLYGILLDKFGTAITEKSMKDATPEEKQAFIKEMKERQFKKLEDKLTPIFSRIVTDCVFLDSYEDIMAPYKTIQELREDNEIANNHLQSVENERSILQRDIDVAIDKLESVCENILED